MMRGVEARFTPYIQFRCIQPRYSRCRVIELGAQNLEAGLNISRFKETLKQPVSCDSKHLVDGVGPGRFRGVVDIVVVVDYQWFDETPPHKIVTEQTGFDEMAHKPRRA